MSGQALYLVRHGRTTLNAQDRLRGLADPPLDETGIAQAEAVAEALADRGIGVVYSSPLGRAATTARIIASRLGVTATEDPRFNDRDYGPWTGRERAEVADRFGAVDAAPGVEPTDAVLARARPALDAVLDEHPGIAVAVVSHDAVIRPLVMAVDAGLDPEIGTGSWSELRREGGAWRVVSAGNVP